MGDAPRTVQPGGYPAATAGPRTLLEQADEVSDLARRAFAVGDLENGIAAVTLAASLVQLAKLSAKL